MNISLSQAARRRRAISLFSSTNRSELVNTTLKRIACLFVILCVTAPTFAVARVSGPLPNLSGVRQEASSLRERFLSSTAPSGGGVLPPTLLAVPLVAQLAVLIKGEPIPEGFPAMKQRSVFARATATIASFFGLVAPTAKTVNTTIAEPPPPPPAYPNIKYDFNGDGSSDMGRWHPTNTEYKVKNGGSYLTYTVGSSAAIPVPGDYDGGGTTDAATFVPGTWKYKTSPGGSENTITETFSQSGDIPVPDDYDNDNITDAAVYRPATNVWYVRKSSTCTPTCTVSTYTLGASGDIPIPGDFDGDGKTDYAVYHSASGYGYWNIQRSNLGYVSFQWGLSTDVPVQGDFDKDGMSDPAVFRPSTGTWYVAYSETNYSTYGQQAWGNWADQPVPADYDGDGTTDFAIWRETTGGWHILTNNGEGGGYITATLGVPGDRAVPSAYTKQVGGTVTGYEMGGVRLNPKNATGGTNLYSQNFGWSTSLVDLPGRSGMDLSLGIGYSSLVWAKHGSVMYFDPDTSNVTPGFRLGFPVIEPIYYDSVKDKWIYMMVTPSGARVEFRQTTVTATYETPDSTYTQLVTNATYPNDPVENISLTIKTADGTQMSYSWIAGAYRCTQIKDRNGNYISITNDATLGRLETVTDTLGRVITVNYNNDGLPTTIQQTWIPNNGASGTTTHTWATLSYTPKIVDTDFHTNITGIVGPPENVSINVLDKITYADGSATKFDYNGYIQVKKVSTVAADAHVLNYTETNLASPSATPQDCPKMGETKTWAENFNSGSEVVVTNDAPTSSSFTGPSGSESTSMVKVTMAGHPTTGFYSKIHFGSSGYKEGLTIATEDCTATDCTSYNRVRWSWTKWTQDNTGVSYLTNPRVEESQVGDGGNTKKTAISYFHDTGTGIRLPNEIEVGDASNVLKTQTTTYNWNSNYISRRIIGLPVETNLFDASSALVSKVTYAYDQYSMTDLSGTTQHCTTTGAACPDAYTIFHPYRGLLTNTKRWDVNAPTAEGSAVYSQTAYNIAGSPVSQTDPEGRVTTISYADVWNDGATRTTFAYATTVTDPGGFSSTIKYRYDFGANVWTRSPKPTGYGNTYGKTTSRTFDDAKGRIVKEKVDNTGAYTRYAYAESGNAITTFTTIVDANNNNQVDAGDEVETLTEFDGAGRVRRTRTENPTAPVGDYTGRRNEYDILGRIKRETVPTEINSSWQPVGDDDRGMAGNEYIWLWNTKQYDWNSRVTRIIPTDSNTNGDQDTIITYVGCGCAGGQQTIIEGPLVPRDDIQANARRKQRVTEDILGRKIKAEVFEWNGSTVYSTVENEYNGRDQVTNITEYVGTNGDNQETTMTYDGHGRLYQKHLPQWYDWLPENPRYTAYTYHADDTVATMTDPRGVVATYSYGKPGDQETEDRALLTKIAYATPSPNPTPSDQHVPDVADVTFAYDNAGNRVLMADGTGTLGYEYDELSRLKKETKDFADNFEEDPPAGGYFLKYEYHLSGGLKSIEDPFGQKTVYGADKVGRLTKIGDQTSPTSWVSSVSHRAFGGIKQTVINTQNATTQTLTYNDALRPVNYVADNATTDSETELQNAEYDYYKDGRINTVTNEASPTGWFNHDNKYDFAGRLKVNGAGPFAQWLSYDAFNNLTARQNLFYGFEDSFQVNYTNNRKSGGTSGTTDTYNNAGNVVMSYFASSSKTEEPIVRQHKDWKWWTFDVAGGMTYFRQFTSAVPYGGPDAKDLKQNTAFDGDGRAVKEDKQDRNCERAEAPEECTTSWFEYPSRYFLVSSVTGQRIAEVAPGYNGALHYIYMDGTKIAETYDGGSSFTLTDPITGSSAPMDTNGSVDANSRTELAGLGTSVPLYAPQSYPPPPPRGGDVGDAEFGCKYYLNGQEIGTEACTQSELAGADSTITTTTKHYRYLVGDNESQKMITMENLGVLGGLEPPLRGGGLVGFLIKQWTTTRSVSSTVFFTGGQQRRGPKIDKRLPINIRKLVVDLATRPDCADILARFATELAKKNSLDKAGSDGLVGASFDNLEKIEINAKKAGSGATTDGDSVWVHDYSHLPQAHQNALYAKYILQEVVHNFKAGASIFSDSGLSRIAETVLSGMDQERSKKIWTEFKRSGHNKRDMLHHFLINQFCQYTQAEVDSGQTQ